VLYEFQIGDTGLGGAADTLQARGGWLLACKGDRRKPFTRLTSSQL